MALAAAAERCTWAGDFERLGGQPRMGAGAVDLDSATLSTGTPTCTPQARRRSMRSWPPKTLSFSGVTSDGASGQIHQGVVEVDLDEGKASSWNPAPDDSALSDALALDRSRRLLGGRFEKVGGAIRKGLSTGRSRTRPVDPARRAPRRVLHRRAGSWRGSMNGSSSPVPSEQSAAEASGLSGSRRCNGSVF